MKPISINITLKKGSYDLKIVLSDLINDTLKKTLTNHNDENQKNR